MISHKHKCIFVHIPKTAGSSIEYIFWPRREDKTEANLWDGFVDEFRNKYQTDGLQHLLGKQIRQEVGTETFDAYYKFTFVRNPWSKMVSGFHYLHKRPDLMRFLNVSGKIDFKTYIALTQKKLHAHWDLQTHYAYDDNGELLVDFVGKFESLDADTLRMLKDMSRQGYPLRFRARLYELGIKKIPHKKMTDKKTHYSQFYDDESREMVADIYHQDIEHFGYHFEQVAEDSPPA